MKIFNNLKNYLMSLNFDMDQILAHILHAIYFLFVFIMINALVGPMHILYYFAAYSFGYCFISMFKV